MTYCATMKEHDEAVKEAVDEATAALRARLAECEAVMEQAIYAIRSGGERHLFSDESEAIELYEAYKSSHEKSGEHSPERKD